MKKKLVVPEFQNEAEEAAFWAKLDLSEYFEPSDFKRGVVFPSLKQSELTEQSKMKTKYVTIRFPEQLIDEAKEKAQKLKVPYQKLVRDILQYGISSIKV